MMTPSMRFGSSCISAIRTRRLPRPTATPAALLSRLQQVRHAAQLRKSPGYPKSSKDTKSRPKSRSKAQAPISARALAKRKNARTTFPLHDLTHALQFPLVDAMRYLRAAEVGCSPTGAKYEVHVRLRTFKTGLRVRNRIRLPYPVKTIIRTAVICPPDSKHAKAAEAAGATVVGEQTVFDAVKAGKINFDRCICLTSSLPALLKSGIARILGPRGLMPSVKTKTVVTDPASCIASSANVTEYKERLATVRLAVGNLSFTPEQVRRNIQTLIEALKQDFGSKHEIILAKKSVHEVVLSSSHGPGLSLNGDFRGPDSPPTEDLCKAL